MHNFGFAWSKLYLAVADLASTEGPLLDRVRAAYWHLAPLNSTNTAPQTFLRLKMLREEFSRRVSVVDEDDGTITLRPLTPQQAAAIAGEIISMFDEVAKAAGAEALGGSASDSTAAGHGAILN